MIEIFDLLEPPQSIPIFILKWVVNEVKPKIKSNVCLANMVYPVENYRSECLLTLQSLGIPCKDADPNGIIVGRFQESVEKLYNSI